MKRYNSYYLRRFERPRHWWDIDWPVFGRLTMNLVLMALGISFVAWFAHLIGAL